jgi:hypothetical protein
MTRVTPASYSVYAPLRYEVTRPFAKKFCEKSRRLRFLRGREKADSAIKNELWTFMNKKIHIGLAMNALAMNEANSLIAYCDFFTSGRIIYDFRKTLTFALLSTDAGKVKFSSVKFPYDSFYLHFGDFRWPDDYALKIEGIYVNKYMSETGELCVNFQPIGGGKFTSPFNVELDNSHDNNQVVVNLNDDYADIDGFFNRESQGFAALVEEVSEVAGGREFADFFGITALDSIKNTLIVKVVINCLLYLSAVPSDVDEVWDDRAPRDVVRRATNSDKNGARDSAERTLNNQDYLKVKLIGRKFSEGAHGHEHHSAKKATHIRRGHFKNQAYGPEWSEHRVIFVPPVLVNSDSGDIPGRIYEI